MRPHRIEIAQNRDPPRAIAAVQVAQNLLHHQFRLPIGIRGGERLIFREREPCGSPYTVAEELNTNCLTPHSPMASKRRREPTTLLS